MSQIDPTIALSHFITFLILFIFFTLIIPFFIKNYYYNKFILEKENNKIGLLNKKLKNKNNQNLITLLLINN